MHTHPANERRWLLLLAGGEEAGAVRRALGGPELAPWQLAQAGSFEQARVDFQVRPCDVVLLDASAYDPSCGEGLAWLARQADVPVILLADDPALARHALEHGALAWLPRREALGQPGLVRAALEPAARLGERLRRAERDRLSLRGCQERVNRLLELLWEAAHGEGQGRWHSQRSMLQRLEEEVSRSQRRGGPVTLVLGEMLPGEDARWQADGARQVAAWTAERIGRAKRRCDVAGRYGTHGFMLLLPQAGADEALGCCRRLQGVLQKVPRELPAVQACFGVAFGEGANASVQGLLSRAEGYLEKARVSPPSRIVLDDALQGVAQ